MRESLRALARTGWRPSGRRQLATAAGPMRYRVVRADPGAAALVIGLHGFGSDEAQIGTLLALNVPTPMVYLAPRAPIPEGRGASWFDLQLDADGHPSPEPASLDAALVRLHAFAASAARAWRTDPARTVLVGYSQGGALALAAALRDPGPFTAIASIAGGVGPDTAAVPRVPLFLGYGTLDPTVSTEAARARVAAWSEADVTASEAEAPHVVAAQHRADLSEWLRRHLSLTPPAR